MTKETAAPSPSAAELNVYVSSPSGPRPAKETTFREWVVTNQIGKISTNSLNGSYLWYRGFPVSPDCIAGDCAAASSGYSLGIATVSSFFTWLTVGIALLQVSR